MATTMTAAELKEADDHEARYEADELTSPCECPSCQKRRAVFHEQRARRLGTDTAFPTNSEKDTNGLSTRTYMATQFMAALVRRGVMGGSFDSIENCRRKAAAEAVALADALLMELVK